MQMNRVVFAGFLAKKRNADSCLRALLSLTRGWERAPDTRTATGEIKQHTNWHSLSFYGELTNIALALEKGDNVYVDGRIEQREFTPRDGSKLRTVHEIVVTQFHVIAQLRNACKAHSPAETDEAPSVIDEVENDWPVGGLT